MPLGLATVVLALYNFDPKTDKSLRFTPVWREGGRTQHAGKPAFIIGGSSSVGQYGTCHPHPTLAVPYLSPPSRR